MDVRITCCIFPLPFFLFLLHFSHLTSQHVDRPQFEIRQLRAHLAQQDLDLAAEREAAMQIHHAWGKQGRNFQVVEGATPGESDDEGAQRNPREPHGTAGKHMVCRAEDGKAASELLMNMKCWIFKEGKVVNL